MSVEIKPQSELTVAMGFFVALAVAGVIMVGAIVEDFACARASSSWRTVDGVVLSAASDRAPLRYAYLVEGRSYEGARVQFRTAGFAAGVIEDAAPGDVVPVRVSPDDAAVSTLQAGGSGTVFAVYATLAILLVFIGLGGLVRTLTRAGERDRGLEEVGSLPLSLPRPGE